MLGGVAVEGLEDVGAFEGEGGGGGAFGFYAAFAELNDVGVELEGFFYVVRDGEDGDVAGAELAAHFGEELVAEGAVDAVEGLVEEEEAAVGGGEGSGEGDALTLAAG